MFDYTPLRRKDPPDRRAPKVGNVTAADWIRSPLTLVDG